MLGLLALVLPATALALTLRPASSAKQARMPKSKAFSGVPQVGALYRTASATTHVCTASVVHGSRGNLLITAAHCVRGTGAGMVFVPGLHGTQAPYGRWTVIKAHMASRWISGHDPRDDVAFLTVAPRVINGVSTQIEKVTGGYALGSTAKPRQLVTVTGYPAGTNNNPITCTVRAYVTARYPSFDCHGYVGGTSGSPWVRKTAHGLQIAGIIGGLRTGGCYEYTSYSSPLARDIDDAYTRADKDEPSDVAPRPGSSGC